MAEWQMNSQPEKEGKYLVTYCYCFPWDGVAFSKDVKAERKKDMHGHFYWNLCDGSSQGFVADHAIVAWKELE